LSAQFRKLNFKNYIKFAAVKQNSNLQKLSKTSKIAKHARKIYKMRRNLNR
jgi:hypothetical protein